MGRIFKPFLKMFGWVDYRKRYEIISELSLQRIHECNVLKRQKNEIERDREAAVNAVQELTQKVDVLREEQRIYQYKIETYESLIYETSILLEQLKTQTGVFSVCFKELQNRYPRLFSNATTTKTTN